jgi:hypothetical protein
MPPTPDRPFAVWTVFRGLPRWYFARGCPPPLRATTGWVRALHTSVLLGAMGLAWSAVGVVVGYFAMQLMVTSSWPRAIVGMMVCGSFGLIYGLGVLLPLSRWIGRPWWLTGFTVMVSVLVYAGIDLLFFQPIWAWTGRNHPLTVALMYSCIGILLGLCFVAPMQRRSWWLLPLIVGGASVTPLAEVTRSGLLRQFGWPFLRWDVVSVLLGVQAIVMFVVVTTAALGMRLWTGDDPAAAEPDAPGELAAFNATPSAVQLSNEVPPTHG